MAIKIQLLATLHWQKCLQKISCSIKCANKLFVCSFDTKLIANSVVNNEYCLNIVKLYVHSNACTSHQSSSYMSICKKIIAFQWLSSVWLIFDNNDSELVLNTSSKQRSYVLSNTCIPLKNYLPFTFTSYSLLVKYERVSADEAAGAVHQFRNFNQEKIRQKQTKNISLGLYAFLKNLF